MDGARRHRGSKTNCLCRNIASTCHYAKYAKLRQAQYARGCDNGGRAAFLQKWQQYKQPRAAPAYQHEHRKWAAESLCLVFIISALGLAFIKQMHLRTKLLRKNKIYNRRPLTLTEARVLAGRRAGDTGKAAAPVRRPSRPSPTTDPLILLLPRAVATISPFFFSF